MCWFRDRWATAPIDNVSLNVGDLFGGNASAWGNETASCLVSMNRSRHSTFRETPVLQAISCTQCSPQRIISTDTHTHTEIFYLNLSSRSSIHMLHIIHMLLSLIHILVVDTYANVC